METAAQVPTCAKDHPVPWTVLPVLPGILILKNWVAELVIHSSDPFWFLHWEFLCSIQ